MLFNPVQPQMYIVLHLLMATIGTIAVLTATFIERTATCGLVGMCSGCSVRGGSFLSTAAAMWRRRPTGHLGVQKG